MFDLLIKIPGPTFITYFSILSIGSIVIAWLWFRLSDNSTSYSLPTLTRFSSFEIAALRDGRKGVIQTVLFNLWHKEKLSVAGKGRTAVIRRNSNVDQAMRLDPIEDTIYHAISTTNRNPVYFFQDKALHRTLAPHLKAINRTLESAHLKHTEAALNTAFKIRNLVLMLILGIGLTKLFFGLYYDKPVLWLIILLVIFTFVAFKILTPALTTRLGRRYLEKLYEHFAWVKSGVTDELDPSLAIAIFGMTVLTSFSAFNPFEQAFARTAAPGSASNGGCGGGCGGSSGDGGGDGGCGGGCGGCGG